MIVVDSGVWIDQLKDAGTSTVARLDQALQTEIVALGDIILLEILQGARDDLHARRLQRVLEPYRWVEMLNSKIAIQSAANFRLLRTKGITIRKHPI